VLAYSYRVLHGQLPHRDFVSTRPAGSAYLHLIDFLIPGPLFEVSRVIALCEYVAYTALFAWLVYEIAPWRWSVSMTMAAAGAVLVNLNRFPLMAWYTIDGLLLVAVGLLLVQRGVKRNDWATICVGFFILGLAGLTKQSFVPATGLGWLLLWPRLMRTSWRQRLRDLVMTGVYGATPLILYLLVISGLGASRALRTQLFGSTPLLYGLPLLYPWLPDRDLVALAVLTALSVAIAVVRTRRSLLQSVLASGMTVIVVGASLSDQLGLRSDEWGIRIFWMTVGYCVASSLNRQSPDVVGFALVGVAWMSSLSLSFFYPNLVAGTLAVYLLQRTWVGVTLPRIQIARLAPAVAAILALAITAAVFGNTRSQDVYLDRTANQLSATLSPVSPAFGGIRTNPLTAAYLTQMSACIGRFPARYVAILPENAAMYPALGLTNPFPIDWLWPYDVHGSESRIVETTDQLNWTGDYVVLFQTVDEAQIVGGNSLPAAMEGSTITTYTPLTDEIYARLKGIRTTCGSFLVVYAPAR